MSNFLNTKSRLGNNRRAKGETAGVSLKLQTGVAQLVEHWSPKPAVAGSIPAARALFFSRSIK